MQPTKDPLPLQKNLKQIMAEVRHKYLPLLTPEQRLEVILELTHDHCLSCGESNKECKCHANAR